MDGFLAALLVLTLADWVPWYRVVIIVALLPLGMLEIEKLTSHTDQVL